MSWLLPLELLAAGALALKLSWLRLRQPTALGEAFDLPWRPRPPHDVA